MAKKKYQVNEARKIRAILFLTRGSEAFATKEQELSIMTETIEYNYIKQICQEFLREERVDFPTNIYFIDAANFADRILVTPAFVITFTKVLNEMQGNLVLVINNAIEDLKTTFQSIVKDLKEEISDLKLQIETLRKPMNMDLFRKNSFASQSPLMLQTHPYLQKHYSRAETSNEVQLDIAVLFSEPLYDQERKKITSPAVDFRSEITRLHSALQNSFKPSIIMRCQIATFESLQTTIKYSKPKIMHIICHGNSEGNLEFQDDSRNTLGLLELLRPSDLKNLLKLEKDMLPDLVFINSCHSENVGRAFFELGVPNVVMINSQDLISDEAAQIFSQNFYRQIFKGSKICQAFSSSKSKVQLKHPGGICCCNHNLSSEPHRQNCQWYRMFKIEPIQSHRNYHVPNCQCQMKNMNRHKYNCQWAIKTLFEINPDYRVKETNGQTITYRFPQIRQQFPSYFNHEQKSLTICCCPTLDRPHTESRKFKILTQNNGESVLMPIDHNFIRPQITDLTSTELLEAHDKSKAIFGRQRQLFQFLRAFHDTNLMYVYGKSGVGLTTFTIKASTYMMQRRVFQFFFFIDLYDIKDQTIFRYKFNQITKFQYNSNNTICQFGIFNMKNRKILFLLDNCDSFIDKDAQTFYQQIQLLLRQFTKGKIIITYKQQTHKIFDSKKINEVNLGYQLLAFEQRHALYYIHNKFRNKTDLSIGMKQLRQLIKKYQILKIPKILQSLYQTIPVTCKNFKYYQLEHNIQQVKLSDPNALIKSVLNQLKNNQFPAYQFLVFCSLFSDGVTFTDINMFSCYQRANMSIELPVKRNWQEHYLLLMERQPIQPNISDYNILPPPTKLQPSISLNQELSSYRKNNNDDTRDEGLDEPHDEPQNNQFAQLQKITGQSYFIDRNGPNKFIIKRFIRDFLWKSYENDTTHHTKFLFVAYFSVILQILFKTLKQQNYIHEQLSTYSAISSAGIFKYGTTLQDIYGRRSLTQSVQFALSFMTDLNDIFMNNELLQQKMKKTNHSTFIMNHRQDFIKFYDNKWSDVYEYLQKRKKGQQKMFIVLLQNLLIYIPTALKIAGAQQSLLQYVVKRSQKQLKLLKIYSDTQRNLKLILKLYIIGIGINMIPIRDSIVNSIIITQTNNITQIKQYFTAGFAQIRQSNSSHYKNIPNLQLYDIQKVFQMEQYMCDLLNDQSSLKMNNIADFQHLLNKKNQYINYGSNQSMGKNFNVGNYQFQPLLRAKQGLVIVMLFLKYIKKNIFQFALTLKSYKGPQHQQSQPQGEIFGILKICKNCIQIFKIKKCFKLKLKAELISVELFWIYNEKYANKQQQENMEEVDQWGKKLVEYEKFFLNDANRLRGFTKFEEKIKQLKQKFKQKLWNSASRRLIFMKAFPLSTRDKPILKNLIRKKNNFRLQIQKLLTENRCQKSSNDSQLCLDISTKYDILTIEKIKQQIRARCSIMFLNVDIKKTANILNLICQNQILQQQLLPLNEDFISLITKQNVLIFVLSGIQTASAIAEIHKLSPSPPILISLEQKSLEKHLDYNIDYADTDQMDTNFIQKLVNYENQIKQAELVYTKKFIENITKKQIKNVKDVIQIHKIAAKQMEQSIGNRDCVKAKIQWKRCSQDIYLKFGTGSYRDLSPGYEGNHNMDPKTEAVVAVRRWKKMIEFFKFIRDGGKQITKNNITSGRKYAGSGYSVSGGQNNENIEESRFRNVSPTQSTPISQQNPTYINIYGDNGCGKSCFIRQIAKILIEREFYNYGVFIFDGKKIQKQFNGDFELYLRKQANLNKIPVLKDFYKLLNSNTILIIDDFHLIKSRVNARFKIFLDKLLNLRVNLVLVSVSELKLQYLQNIRKIRLDSMDRLEVQILAFNIINMQGPQDIQFFQQQKKKIEQQKYTGLTVKDLQQIEKDLKTKKNPNYEKNEQLDMKKLKRTFTMQEL